VEKALMSREAILNKVRTALRRSAGQGIAEPPPVRLYVDQVDAEARVGSMLRAVEALAGKARLAASGEAARAYVGAVLDGRTAVASNSPFLLECGVVDLAGVLSGFTDAAELRALCATADVGITSADYALADTGTLVMLSSPAEARLISLVHNIARPGRPDQFDGPDHRPQPHGGHRADIGARRARAGRDSCGGGGLDDG
jgi:L-lactate utilization protein LutC